MWLNNSSLHSHSLFLLQVILLQFLLFVYKVHCSAEMEEIVIFICTLGLSQSITSFQVCINILNSPGKTLTQHFTPEFMIHSTLVEAFPHMFGTQLIPFRERVLQFTPEGRGTAFMRKIFVCKGCKSAMNELQTATRFQFSLVKRGVI